MLNICHNCINAKGVKYLANALNSNEVLYDLLVASTIDVSLSFLSDSLNTESRHA